MESAMSEANNVADSSVAPKVEEMGVSEEINNSSEVTQSDKNVASDKELSWEKIAAEFTEEDEEEETHTQITQEVITEPPVEPESETVQDTVINTVTEEKTEEDVATPIEEPQNEDVATPVEEAQSEDVAIPVEESQSEDVAIPVEEPQSEEVLEEAVEISELKPEEEPQIAEAIENIEYSVVEAEEVETHEIIEEHIAQTASSETVVIINPDQSQTEITIEQVEDGDEGYKEEVVVMSKENETVDDPIDSPGVPQKPKKKRGRKPIADIPLHVLGRDINKPAEGVSNGGRPMPKPRLGVKVPYKNLTSQIVSKAEIEKEIMERFKMKQEQNAANSGDVLFARKLTQRLAKKLIPNEKDKSDIKPPEATSSDQNDKSSEIKNNSDLLAILEGEDDDLDLKKQQEIEKKEADRNLEKEIALEQLKEFTVKPKIIKSRSEEDEKKPPLKLSSPQKESSKLQKTVEKKEELEPRLKTGVVVKTYTRKRKSLDIESFLPSKKPIVVATVKSEDGGTPSNVYVTKSSRVIKRKVIWDPDEAPSKSPIKSPKSETPKSAEKKVAEKKVVEKSSEKKVEEKKVTEKKIVEKSPEKKIIEKEKQPEKKVLTPVKKVIQSPKKPKRLTEVDKLLMDEGAVNMLYDVKTNEETSPQKKKNNKSVISLDKAHKELMSKTSAVKNDLVQNASGQKSLRKKEGVSPPKKDTPSSMTRKKSKDSTRSSTPPYNAAEASRIIRRHSSSSFSSNEEGDEESVKSPRKKIKKNEKPKETKNNNNTVTEMKTNHVDKNVGHNKMFTVTKKNKLVSIKLLSEDNKCYINEQLLKELTASLKEFGKDDDCYVVAITSDSSESFCEGLDYRVLLSDDEATRKKKATEVASLVKEFLRCLLNFPKVLVAGIQGDCVGLGVTMLPLFDLVIASDTSTFSIPNGKLGCVPEAGFLLTVPHLNSNGLANELLFAGQTVKADDAFRRGLVTRLCWPEKYQQELKAMLAQIGSQSRQGIVAGKQQLRHGIVQGTESALSAVCKVLVENWTSPECQKNFAK